VGTNGAFPPQGIGGGSRDISVSELRQAYAQSPEARAEFRQSAIASFQDMISDYRKALMGEGAVYRYTWTLADNDDETEFPECVDYFETPPTQKGNVTYAVHGTLDEADLLASIDSFQQTLVALETEALGEVG